LAVNAIVYGLAVAWERRLVAHHVNACRAEQQALAEFEELQLAA
jgi:hypothetical protein